MPAAWVAAKARDRAGLLIGADPLPERRAARLLAAFILTGLFFLALPGTFMGVGNLLLIAAEKLPSAPRPEWIQAHGQAQIFGWVGSFILGISLYVLPKFRRVPLQSIALAWITWALWTAGVALRWEVGIGLPWPRFCLIVAAALEIAAFALSQYLLVIAPARAAHGALAEPSRSRGRSPEGASTLGIIGFSGLGVVLIGNLVAAIAAPTGAAAYSPRLDRILVELAIWAFIIPLVLGYSTRFITIFVGLRTSYFSQPPAQLGKFRPCVSRLFAVLVVALAIATLLQRFSVADALAVTVGVAAVWGLRIFEPSAHQAKCAAVYGGYPAFIRIAYAWMIVGAVLGIAADFLSNHPGISGASRHAITVGFIATLIFALGPRILPSFLNSRRLYSRALMGLSLWFLTLGCAMRVTSEAAAYGTTGGWAWRMLPLSAFIELGAVLLFVANLALTMLQSPPVWFRLETLNGTTTLYWCVASYPRTKRLLIKAGLGTLRGIRAIPKSLTLAEAAEADGVAADDLLRTLRFYFKRLQPAPLESTEMMEATSR